MSQAQEAGILAAIVLLGLIWGRTGLSPAGMVQVVALHMRALAWWMRREAWPAMRSAAERYDECLGEVRRWG